MHSGGHGADRHTFRHTYSAAWSSRPAPWRSARTRRRQRRRRPPSTGRGRRPPSPASTVTKTIQMMMVATW